MEAEFEAERIREEEREAERLAQRQKLQEEQLKERQQKVCGGTMMFIKIFRIIIHIHFFINLRLNDSFCLTMFQHFCLCLELSTKLGKITNKS